MTIAELVNQSIVPAKTPLSTLKVLVQYLETKEAVERWDDNAAHGEFRVSDSGEAKWVTP